MYGLKLTEQIQNSRLARERDDFAASLIIVHLGIIGSRRLSRRLRRIRPAHRARRRRGRARSQAIAARFDVLRPFVRIGRLRAWRRRLGVVDGAGRDVFPS